MSAGAWIGLLIVSLELVSVVAPEERITKNVCLVLDRSSSVWPYADESLEMCKAISAQATDEMNLTGVCFALEAKRYPKWISLPDAVEQAELMKWLTTERVGGSTYVRPALRLALGLDKDELSVVLVTDGEFLATDGSVLQSIRDLQAWRKTKGLKPAVIACVGVGEVKRDILKEIAKLGRGGYWHVEPKKAETEVEDDDAKQPKRPKVVPGGSKKRRRAS